MQFIKFFFKFGVIVITHGYAAPGMLRFPNAELKPSYDRV